MDVAVEEIMNATTNEAFLDVSIHDLERDLLTILMTEPYALGHLTDYELSAASFTSEAHRILFAAIEAIYERGDNPGLESVWVEMDRRNTIGTLEIGELESIAANFVAPSQASALARQLQAAMHGRWAYEYADRREYQKAAEHQRRADQLLNGSIPDSGACRDQESGMQLVRAWQQDEPAPRHYAVDQLVPTGATTTLFAPGGFGKSLLGVLLATTLATGRSFLDHSTIKSSVLYIDAELDEDEFLRRAYRVARGLGLESPPEGVNYVRLRGSLMNPITAAEVAHLKEEAGADVVILDSFMASTLGGDMVGNATDTTQAYRYLDNLGTCITIDHTPKPAPDSNHSNLSPYGSVFKQNWSRSVLQLVRAEGGGLVLRQTKHNFGPLADQIPFSLEFRDDQIDVELLAPNDDRLAGIGSHLPAVERVAHALASHGPSGATVEELAQDVERSVSTVRDHLTVLRKQGRADTDNEGRWWQIPDSGPLRDQESGIREFTTESEDDEWEAA